MQNLKKSTARFVREEVEKTKYSFASLRKILLELLFAIVVGLGLSALYVFLLG